MTQTQTIYFNMDGTIADLYSVDGWLDYLIAENPFPYQQARPLLDMELLTSICRQLQQNGMNIGIVSWCSKESSQEYKALVRQAKREWLAQNFPLEFDEIHIVKYGQNKRSVGGNIGDILFDDEPQNIANWIGHRKQDRVAINCKNNPQVIIDTLETLLKKLSQ